APTPRMHASRASGTRLVHSIAPPLSPRLALYHMKIRQSFRNRAQVVRISLGQLRTEGQRLGAPAPLLPWRHCGALQPCPTRTERLMDAACDSFSMSKGLLNVTRRPHDQQISLSWSLNALHEEHFHSPGEGFQGDWPYITLLHATLPS